MSTQTPRNNKSRDSGGGGSAGRGGGSGGRRSNNRRRGGRSGGRGHSNNRGGSANNNNKGDTNESSPAATSAASKSGINNKNVSSHFDKMSDQDILIAFMPYIRSGNFKNAAEIHERYQKSNNQRNFVSDARQFLKDEQQPKNQKRSEEENVTKQVNDEDKEEDTSSKKVLFKEEEEKTAQSTTTTEAISPPLSRVESTASPPTITSTPYSTPSTRTPFPTPNVPRDTSFPQHQQQHNNNSNLGTNLSIEQQLPSIPMVSSIENSLLQQQQQQQQSSTTTTNPPADGSISDLTSRLERLIASDNNEQRQPQQQPSMVGNEASSSRNNMKPITPTTHRAPPPPPPGLGLPSQPVQVPATATIFPLASPPGMPSTLSPLQQQQQSPAINPATAGGGSSIIPQQLQQQEQQLLQQSSQSAPTPTTATTIMTKKEEEKVSEEGEEKAQQAPAAKPKKVYQPKRVWCRLDEQPGRLLANDVAVSNVTLGNSNVIEIRPRSEFTARWILPLKYLRERAAAKKKEKEAEAAKAEEEEANAGGGGGGEGEKKKNKRQPKQKQPKSQQDGTVKDALQGLAVGLYRRGSVENDSKSSIITKEIFAPPGERNNKDYPYYVDVKTDTVWGTVPFFTPRTPGYVVSRLYWLDEPLYTLATGPALYVNVSAAVSNDGNSGRNNRSNNNTDDVESTLRFILSNFKQKSQKAQQSSGGDGGDGGTSNTSLSSILSLATVFEQFNPANDANVPSNAHHQHQHRNYHHQHNSNNANRYDGASRAAWGCILESKKVLKSCAIEHEKTKERLKRLEDEVNQLKNELDKKEADREEELHDEEEGGGGRKHGDNDEQKADTSNNQKEVKEDASTLGDDDESTSSNKLASLIKEKTKALNTGRASSERRWKDAHVAFASLLKSILSNNSSTLLVKRNLLQELRLEYELWCPLCELFAPSPFQRDKNEQSTIGIDRNGFPYQIGTEHFQVCTKSRIEMQVDTLGFEPNTKPLEEIIMPDPAHKKMNRAAVDTFNRLSSSMCQLYQEVYMTSDNIHRQRELVRAHTESAVSKCDAFPTGTRVVVFGSAANGFGSPSSDLDMCLQLPPNAKLGNDGSSQGGEDVDDHATGAGAMAKLSELLEQGGMKDVDTARLTARIPVVMFNCPRPGLPGITVTDDGKDQFIECDLSMQNPLACLNTSLLLTYSRINPVTTVLVAIIKRWAKSRDINSPFKGSLSSYGYILMLLHFMTYHRPLGNGLVGSFDKTRRDPRRSPLLPNLQWMDSRWLQSRPDAPYQEMASRPKQLIPHPSEASFAVNAYFHRLPDQAALINVQRRFPGQDSSVAILLASFFRYYAYEFDYKKYVVSLHSTMTRGLVEREVKAETDTWRVNFNGLSIEDPFETFYDVAHVVKGGEFHRLRNELALAYSKIVDVASGKPGQWRGRDLSSMTGMDIIDWICEPVVSEVEDQ